MYKAKDKQCSSVTTESVHEILSLRKRGKWRFIVSSNKCASNGMMMSDSLTLLSDTFWHLENHVPYYKTEKRTINSQVGRDTLKRSKYVTRNFKQQNTVSRQCMKIIHTKYNFRAYIIITTENVNIVRSS